MPTMTMPKHTRSLSSNLIPPRSNGVSQHPPHRASSSWSGPLSNFFRPTPSPNPDQNVFVFPSRPSTPIESDLYKEYKNSEPPRSPNKPGERAHARSRSGTMPVSQHPSPLASYDAYSQPKYQYSSLLPQQTRKYTASASSNHGRYPPDMSYAYPTSACESQLPAYSFPKQYSSSSSHLLHVPPQRHRRSRSASISLPSGHRIHEDHTTGSLTTGWPLDSFNSTRGRGRTRSNSFSQPYPVRTRKSNNRLRKSRSRTRSLQSPVEHAFRDDSRRVRFILPATIHLYLYNPPFKMSVKRPVSTDLAKYYKHHLSQPATKPTVSFLLITTPHLPWQIRLGAVPVSAFPSSTYHHAPLAYLTVHEVLNGIYLALREYITVKEYESLRLNRPFRDQVITAYRTRKSQERQDAPGDQEPMRRVDWLVGRTIFQGLEESGEGEGVWQLRLGWRQGV